MYKFKIGTDPEFNILFHGQRVSAEEIMPQLFKEGCSATNMGMDFKDIGNIGWDGASATGEIRPCPSEEPKDVIENIRKLFTKLIEKTNYLDLSTKNNASPIGGHIHLDLPEDLYNSKENITKKLSTFYLTLLCSENSLNSRIRLQQSYGKLGDARYDNEFHKPDGSMVRTLEFRTPSAEWLTTPEIALGTLCFFKVVYNEIINNPKEFQKLSKDYIYHSVKEGEYLQEMFVNNLGIIKKFYSEKLKKAIRQFSLYPVYKTEIDFILNSQKVLSQKEKAKYEILNGWGLKPKPKIATVKDILSCKINNTIPEALYSVFHVWYNADRNVSTFVEAFKNAVIDKNWVTKNVYAFYGIKEGIKPFIAFEYDEDSGSLPKKIFFSEPIIKNQADVRFLYSAFEKIQMKFRDNGLNPINAIDERIAEVEDKEAKLYFIGIPSAIREQNKIKEFLEFIINLEKTPEKLICHNRFDEQAINFPASTKSSIEENILKSIELKKTPRYNPGVGQLINSIKD